MKYKSERPEQLFRCRNISRPRSRRLRCSPAAAPARAGGTCQFQSVSQDWIYVETVNFAPSST